MGRCGGHSVRIMPNDCEAGSLLMWRMRSIVGPLSYLLISDLLVLAIIALAPRTGTVQQDAQVLVLTH
jgi:hypothetical protein